MKKKHLPLPPQAELRRRFDYDEATGRLIYKIPPGKNHPQRVGKPAGTKHSEGGWVVTVNYGHYLNCRLVWMHVYGEDPGELEVDHKDGDRSNDRLSNLRLATRAQQQWNVPKSSRNKSGYKGVIFYARTGRWRAYINEAGKSKHLGYFSTKEEAAAVYQQAAKNLHREFFHA